MKKEEVTKSSTQLMASHKEYNSRIKIRNCECGSPPRTRIDSSWASITVTIQCDSCQLRQDFSYENGINDLNRVLWVMSEAVEKWNSFSKGDFPIVYGRRR